EGSGLLSWNLQTGKRRKIPPKMRGIGHFLATPDGKHLVCTHHDGGKMIVQLPRGNVVRTLEVPGHPVAISRGGRYLVTSLGVTLEIWDVERGSRIASYGAYSDIHTVAISPDGSRLVIGDDVGRLEMLHLHGLTLTA
nr:hypothetical protein [Desulfobacterales bacterium]